MHTIKRLPLCFCLLFAFSKVLFAQAVDLTKRAEETMLRATKYMVENVSTNGGYVWYYLPDLSRRWGEMEAYKTMVWVQDAGTVSMGHLFLDAYRTTGDEYYYQAAAKAAAALIWGQSNAGGWNYMIDFAGDRSLKKWYNTIGKNGWRLEEFQHYYGNDTYDDDVTSDAARFLLRMYLEKMDASYKPSLDKAINFILKSQYALGGWPQRFPHIHNFKKAGHPDYTSFYTFNDDVTWENVNFLTQCYLTLGEQRFLNPIYRGMNFYLRTQTPGGGWAQQYNIKLQPAGARTYEPAALLPSTTFTNTLLLIKFYEYTGDSRFIAHVPRAIAWLEKTRLPVYLAEGGKYTHPRFVNVHTCKPIFVHRSGSNVVFGKYYADTIDKKLPGHYSGKLTIDIGKLKQEYKRVINLPATEVTKNSPLIPTNFVAEGTPQKHYKLSRDVDLFIDSTAATILQVINTLDENNRWLIKHVMISNPYIGDGQNTKATDEYATTRVGDKTDTSPFTDTSEQQYISTAAYIKNMRLLMNFVGKNNQNHNSQ